LPRAACGDALNHFLQGLDPQISLSADAPAQSSSTEQPGPSPCQLGAHSLLCAQPLFFDGALPAIIIFFAQLLFTQGRALLLQNSPFRHRLEYTLKLRFRE
jgi:hypothetical protein